MYCTVGTEEHEDGSKKADHERCSLSTEVSEIQPKVKDLVRVLIFSKKQER